MPLFRVTAERSLGVIGQNGRRINPFLVRDIFDFNPHCRIAQRVWDRMEAADEAEVRAFFKQGQDADLEAVRGFEIVLIEPLPATQPQETK